MQWARRNRQSSNSLQLQPWQFNWQFIMSKWSVRHPNFRQKNAARQIGLWKHVFFWESMHTHMFNTGIYRVYIWDYTLVGGMLFSFGVIENAFALWGAANFNQFTTGLTRNWQNNQMWNTYKLILSKLEAQKVAAVSNTKAGNRASDERGKISLYCHTNLSEGTHRLKQKNSHSFWRRDFLAR